MHLRPIVPLPDIDLASIADERLRAACVALLNLVETLSAEVRELRAEVQRLRDENNRLKGEQGKPDIKPNTARPTATDHSSERERHTPKPWSQGRKIALLTVDREEVCTMDRATLPSQAATPGRRCAAQFTACQEDQLESPPK